jgi:hypothetical protein
MEIDGLPVKNGSKRISLNITKGDIGRADRKKPDQCVIARCLRRSLHVKEARVHLGRVYLWLNDAEWIRYITPPPLRSEIIAFDRGGTFEPGEFALLPPSASRRTGQEQGTKTRTKGAGKTRAPPHVVTNVRGGPA